MNKSKYKIGTVLSYSDFKKMDSKAKKRKTFLIIMFLITFYLILG